MLYWLYETAKTLRARGAETPPFKLLFMPLIIYVVLVIAGVVVMAAASGPNSEPAGGLVAVVLAILSVAIIAIIILPFIYYYRFCQAADKATDGKASATVSFLLFIILSAVAAYLIQDALNQTEQQPAGVTATADSTD
jgi:membrane protease YdiL (CAAX protease family)